MAEEKKEKKENKKESILLELLIGTLQKDFGMTKLSSGEIDLFSITMENKNITISQKSNDEDGLFIEDKKITFEDFEKVMRKCVNKMCE